MNHVYGICEPDTAAAALLLGGIDETPVESVVSGDLAAVFSRHAGQPPDATVAKVLDHERVIESLMAHGPVLPVRFGTLVPSRQRLDALLDERRDEWMRALEAVRGAVELGVRITSVERSDQSVGRPATGRDYLLARVRERQRHEWALHAVHEPLAELALASRIRESSHERAAMAASYLIDRATAPHFRQRADALAGANRGLTVTVTGPWPPYSFTVWESSATHS